MLQNMMQVHGNPVLLRSIFLLLFPEMSINTTSKGLIPAKVLENAGGCGMHPDVAMKKGVVVEQLMLPVFVPKTPGNSAPLSTHLARTPLFSPRRRGERKYVVDYLLPSPQGAEIYFSGLELDMGDQDVYLMALHLAANHKPDENIIINRADFLSKIGRKSQGKSMYKWLEDAFERLGRAFLVIKMPTQKLQMPLLGPLALDSNGKYAFSIPKLAMGIFLGEYFGYINLDIRKRINRFVDLAKWLQGYATSHLPGQHVVTVENLKAWSGYSSPTHKFRDSLEGALDELTSEKFIKGWNYTLKKTSVSWLRDRYTPEPRPVPPVMMNSLLQHKVASDA
jgi:hypothetical protein